MLVFERLSKVQLAQLLQEVARCELDPCLVSLNRGIELHLRLFEHI